MELLKKSCNYSKNTISRFKMLKTSLSAPMWFLGLWRELSVLSLYTRKGSVNDSGFWSHAEEANTKNTCLVEITCK